MQRRRYKPGCGWWDRFGLAACFDPRLNLARQVMEETRNHFKDKVFATIINRNVRLGEAPSFGKPIILYDIGSTGAENYISLTEEVLRKISSASGLQISPQ
jgi:chromosome partitioning protein